MGQLTRRHLTGLIVILLALFLPVLGSLGPVGGQPTTSAPAAPPAVGSCVVQTPTGTSPVTCNTAHSGVVLQSWAQATIGPETPTAGDQCSPWAQRFLNETRSTPDPTGAVFSYTFGPGNRWIHGWSWSACVVSSLNTG